jgi:hypothetical protein
MYSFKLRSQSNSPNYIIPSIKTSNLITPNLIKTDNTNYNFNTNYNKNLAPCNSCPKNNIQVNNNDFILDKSETVFNNKNMELTQTRQPCGNCSEMNVIGLRVKNENEKYIYYCKPSNFLNNVNEEYHFEDIIILNKDDKYIILDKNMITNNSSEKLTIEMNSEFYNNIRLPLVFMSKCILHKTNKYFNVNGFLM